MTDNLAKGGRLFLGTVILAGALATDAEAGRLRRRARGPVATPAARVVPTTPAGPAADVVERPGQLGTFTSTPYIFVRGNGTAGGGHSPIDSFGEASMSIYGPLSSFRTVSAPVTTYTRGYDGRTRVGTGTSFSTPNLPGLSPVVYPTQANNANSFPTSGSPPWWAFGTDWIDHN